MECKSIFFIFLVSNNDLQWKLEIEKKMKHIFFMNKLPGFSGQRRDVIGESTQSSSPA